MNPVKRVLRRLRFVYRSAISGRYVSEDYASRHQATTVRETKER
jgi:hypothetical protein